MPRSTRLLPVLALGACCALGTPVFADELPAGAAKPSTPVARVTVAAPYRASAPVRRVVRRVAPRPDPVVTIPDLGYYRRYASLLFLGVGY